MYKSIRYVRCLVFIVDYDFVVLAQNIIVHQTETIQHYQSPLSHALFSVAPKKTQKWQLSKLSQVSKNQIFMINIAKLKIKTVIPVKFGELKAPCCA